MAQATKDDGVLFKKTIFGIDLEYTKTDAAIDTTLIAGGAMLGGVGAAPAAGIAALRSGAMMIGRGVLRSVFKTAAKEGAEVAAKAAVKTAAKETVETGAKAAAKDTIGAGVGKTAKTKLTDASDDALAALAKAKAEGEALRAGAKAAAKEGAEAAAGAGAKAAAAEAAAGAGAKAAAKEGVEKTSKSILEVAAKAGSFAWSSAKLVSFPLRHPVLSLGAVSAGDLATGGKSSELLWDGAIGSWNMTKEHAPSVANAIFEGSLKLGDGLMGFVATGGKKGAEGLKDHLPPGTPLVIREALGNVGKPKAEGQKTPSLTERAHAAMTGAGADDEAANDADAEGVDPLSSPEAGPFRALIAKQLNMDPNAVNGKVLTEKMTQMAKDNPLFAMGMTVGTLYGATGAGKTKMERTMGGIAFGLAFGFMFQFIGKMYPGLTASLMRGFSGLTENLQNGAEKAADKAQGMRSDFENAAQGKTAAPTSQPEATNEARSDVARKFSNAVTPAAPAPGAGEERVDLNRRRPEASNNPQYLQTAGM